MNACDSAKLIDDLNAIRSRWKRTLTALEHSLAKKAGIPLEEVKGQGSLVALEAHVRVHVIDRLLKCLGWDIEDAARILVEDSVDAETSSSGGATANEESRRFLDYHGRDCHSDESFVVVEAKRPSDKPPKESSGEIIEELVRVIPLIIAGETTPRLSAAWREKIWTLMDYAHRVHGTRNHYPARLVITNGEWLIVFSQLEQSLLATEPDASKIFVCRTFDELIERRATLFDLLHYSNLTGEIPPQPPGAVSEFVPIGQEVVCAHVLDVSYVQYGERQPLIALRVALWVSARAGAWVLFRKEYDDDFLPLASDTDSLQQRVDQVRARATDLLAALGAARRVRLLSPEDFERMTPMSTLRGVMAGACNSPLATRLRNLEGGHRITVGDATLFLANDAEYVGCPYHNWHNCRATGDAVGPAPLLAPTSAPKAFFPNGSQYHCAHSDVHAKRRAKCLLLEFEEFMCCKMCSYRERCWAETDPLPCVGATASKPSI